MKKSVTDLTNNKRGLSAKGHGNEIPPSQPVLPHCGVMVDPKSGFNSDPTQGAGSNHAPMRAMRKEQLDCQTLLIIVKASIPLLH